MRVAVGSAFRNSSRNHHLDRYFDQVLRLRDILHSRGDFIRVIAVEGDSRDDTRAQLMSRALKSILSLCLHTRNHGCREWGSVESPERMEKLSYVLNGVLEGVHQEDEVLIYVESDLVWSPETFIRLIEQLKPGVDVIAPLIFAGEHFYDVWGFRKNGARFGPFYPYHHELLEDQLTVVDSVGSSFVMRAEVARGCRSIDGEALVGLCRDVWAKHYSVYCDARERINHP